LNYQNKFYLLLI